MFNSVEELDDALARQSVTRGDWASLLRDYPEFEFRNVQAFEKFMQCRKQSLMHTKVNVEFSQYVNPTSQGMWCAWTEAMMYVPSLRRLREREAEREMVLFAVYLATLGYIGEDAFVGEADVRPEVANRLLAWKAALDFAFTL